MIKFNAEMLKDGVKICDGWGRETIHLEGDKYQITCPNHGIFVRKFDENGKMKPVEGEMQPWVIQLYVKDENWKSPWVMWSTCTECGLSREAKDFKRHRENCSSYQENRYDHDYLKIDNPWQEGYVK